MGRRKARQPRIQNLEDLSGARVRSYVRESTKRQAQSDRYGPALQRADIRRFCKQWSIDDIQHEYFDAASARSADARPNLQRALDDASEYDALLIFHSSRFFRNRVESAAWKSRFAKAGVAIVITESGLISGDPLTKPTEGLGEIMDEAQSDLQARFITLGLRQKFERGLHNGTAPLGYERRYGTPGDPTNSELVPVARELLTVQRIYELYAAGRFSDLDVALSINAELDEEGRPLHRTKRGRPFTDGSIREILTNRTYTGMVLWRARTDEEEVRQGHHEPIVPPERFDEVQRIRAGRVHFRGRRSVDRVYPLTRRAVCHDCGASVAGDTGGQRNRRRMRHARTGECEGWRSHHAHLLEGQLGEFVDARMSLPHDWQKQVLKLLAEPAPRQSENVARRASLNRRLAKLRDLFLWEDISENEYRQQREKLQRTLAEVPQDESAPFDLADHHRAATLLGDFGNLWNHPGVSDEQRKAFIEEVFEQIQIDELGIRAVRLAEIYLPLLAVCAVGGE